MRTLKIVLAYEGTDFVGWQRQPAGTSIQGCLEEALAAIEGQPVTVVGAGRTDAGVHALGQVASCALSHPIPVTTLGRALNAVLPPAVRVLSIEEAPEGFHARYSARFKTYRYLVFNGTHAGPLERRFVWHVAPPLDLPAMADAASRLEGDHDFAALQGAGSATRTTTRRMTTARVRACSREGAFGEAMTPPAAAAEGRVVVFEFTGTGFLRHMVRNAVGSLVEIGLGRRPRSWLDEVLASRNRDQAGPTAPAHGLFLVSVEYQEAPGGPAPAARTGSENPPVAQPGGCL